MTRLFGDAMPEPEPGLDDAGFWAACAKERLVVRHCEDCGRAHHPPLPRCPSCRSTRLDWREPRGPAEIFSFTRVHHAAHEAVVDHLPYDVIVVAWPDTDGVRMVSNLVGGGEPRIGARVELVWERLG
ncbi:MAG TPA: zinc ribbon domain-containing protein, partial [Burkholderiaceae bacterium]|nr:zinc ribbon domain-containing protein [Burkholderiaceae bacterium]